MSEHDPPDAKKIIDRAEVLRTVWSSQDTLDGKMQDLAQLKNIVQTIKSEDSQRPQVLGLKSGLGWTLPKEMAALYTVTPNTHFNNPDPTDKKFQDKLDNVYEPWIAAAKKLSQHNSRVEDRLPLDKQIFGRAWDSILPHPYLWADGVVKEAVEYLNKQKTPEGRSAAEKKVRMAKARTWPILRAYVPARNVWSTFDVHCYLPEVFELRRMRRYDIIQRWGEKAIPGPLRATKDDGNAKLDVIIWANHCYSACVIKDSQDPQLVAEYEHNFYRSPYNVFESDLAPDNDEGVRWIGQMFGGMGALGALDQLFTDAFENERDNLRTPRIWKIDFEKRGDNDPVVAARSKNDPVPIRDGMVLDVNEDLVLGPVQQINPEAWGLMDRIQQFIERNMRRPVLEGEQKSGTSQNTLLTSLQTAQKALDPTLRAYERHDESVVERFACAVRTLGEDVPVFTEKGLIEVGPDDVEDWKVMAQSTASTNLPIDMNALAQVAAVLINQVGLSPATAWTLALNIQNPSQEQRKSNQAKIVAAVMDNFVIPMTLQRLQGAAQAITPEQQKKIQEMLTGASPDLQQYLGAGAPPQGPPMGGAPMLPGNPTPSAQFNGTMGGAMPEGALQGASNTARQGMAPLSQQYGNSSGQ